MKRTSLGNPEPRLELDGIAAFTQRSLRVSENNRRTLSFEVVGPHCRNGAIVTLDEEQVAELVEDAVAWLNEER